MYYMINGHFRLVQKSETGTTGCHFGKIFVIKSHFPNTVYSECAQAEEGPQSKYSGFSFLPYNLKKKRTYEKHLIVLRHGACGEEPRKGVFFTGSY